MTGRHESKDDFPSNASKVEETFTESNLVDNEIVLVNAWSKPDSILELRRKRFFLGHHEVVHQLGMVILLSLGILVLHNGDQAHIFLGDLDSLGLSLLQLNLEHDVLKLFGVALLLNIHIVLIDLVSYGLSVDVLNHLVIDETNGNSLLVFIVVELNLLVFRQVIIELSCTVGGDSCSSRIGQLFSSNHAANFAIRTLTSKDLDVNSVLQFAGTDFSVLETKSSWEVFVKNSDFGNGVVSEESSHAG